jgi:ribonuclease HI
MQSSGLVFGMHRYHRYFESMYDDAGRDDDDENDNGIVPTMASPPPSMEAGGDDVVGEDVIASGSMLGGGTHAPPHRTDAVPSTTTTSIESGGDDDARDDVAIPSDAVDATAIADTTNNIVPDRTYVLRFDGGSRGNPGRAGAGMVLYDGMDGDEIWSGYHYLGDKYTNNEAEYRGLITGLRCALSLGIRRIVIQGDSQLILRQLDGRYRVKSPTLLSYYHEALSLVREFDSAETGHIERSRNSRADELANLAMDSRSSMGFTN